MELKKTMIHTEYEKASATMQTSLEEDINLAESKPDIEKILFSKGQIQIDEIKVGTGRVHLSGKLLYHLLYRTEDGNMSLQNMEGSIPFQEEILMQNVENGDHVTANGDLEDLTLSTINSRKLNLRALITFQLLAEEMKDEEVCEDIIDGKEIEYRKEQKDFLELLLHKKDVYRIKEEVEVSKTMPNMENILWKDVWLKNVNVKAQDKKLLLQGEMQISFVYEATADKTEQQTEYACYEKEIPISGTLECQESEDDVLPDIEVILSKSDMEIRNDIDQEARMVEIDATLSMDIRLYQKKEVDMVADLYGVTQEVVCCNEKTVLRKPIMQEDELIKMNENLKISNGEASILRICHKECSIDPEPVQIQTENGQKELIISGILQVRILYETVQEGEKKKQNFSSTIGNYKYLTKLVINSKEDCDSKDLQIRIVTSPQEISVNMEDHETFGITAVLLAKVLVYCMQQEEMILDMKLYPIDQEKLAKIPGLSIYYVQKGDTIWQIGKKYYVTTERIKSVNCLTTDCINAGDKLIIAK